MLPVNALVRGAQPALVILQSVGLPAVQQERVLAEALVKGGMLPEFCLAQSSPKEQHSREQGL